MREFSIGLNIYTLLYQFIKDKKDAFSKAKEAGFDRIEMIGGFDTEPQELLQTLKGHGLAVTSYHLGRDAFAPEQLDNTIGYNKAIGNDTLVIPCFKFDKDISVKEWEEFAAFLEETAKELKKHNMRLGYHNHAIEFDLVDKKEPWDIVMSNTENVVMQLDIGNARSNPRLSDDDIIGILKRYEGRAKCVHIKPWSKAKGFDCILGQDDINWPKIVDACKEYGGTETFYVEMEGHDTTCERIKPCFDYLANLVLK